MNNATVHRAAGVTFQTLLTLSQLQALLVPTQPPHIRNSARAMILGRRYRVLAYGT